MRPLDKGATTPITLTHLVETYYVVAVLVPHLGCSLETMFL